MRACPNLFDLIYQHAAFPLTWELAAVALRSDKHLPLPLCYIWSQNKPLSLIIRDFKRGFKTRRRGCIHAEGPTRGQTPSCNQSPIQSFLIPFPLSPLFFSYLSLHTSHRCSHLADQTRLYFCFMVSHHVISTGPKYPQLLKSHLPLSLSLFTQAHIVRSENNNWTDKEWD